MATYLVSYDLTRPKEDDYPELLDALRRDGALRILYSEWLVLSDQSAKTVAERYLAHMDADDRIFVCEVFAGRYSYYHLMNQAEALRDYLP